MTSQSMRETNPQHQGARVKRRVPLEALDPYPNPNTDVNPSIGMILDSRETTTLRSSHRTSVTPSNHRFCRAELPSNKGEITSNQDAIRSPKDLGDGLRLGRSAFSGSGVTARLSVHRSMSVPFPKTALTVGRATSGPIPIPGIYADGGGLPVGGFRRIRPIMFTRKKLSHRRALEHKRVKLESRLTGPSTCGKTPLEVIKSSDCFKLPRPPCPYRTNIRWTGTEIEMVPRVLNEIKEWKSLIFTSVNSIDEPMVGSKADTLRESTRRASTEGAKRPSQVNDSILDQLIDQLEALKCSGDVAGARKLLSQVEKRDPWPLLVAGSVMASHTHLARKTGPLSVGKVGAATSRLITQAETAERCRLSVYQPPAGFENRLDNTS